MTSKKIQNLVISGGGAAGFAFYGALKQSAKSGLLNMQDIQHIYATSVGTIMSVVISLDYDWQTLDDYLIKRPWQNVYKFELPMAIQAISNQGIFNKQVIQDTLNPLFKGKDIPININLQDFYNITKKEIHFITTSYNDLTVVDISHKTHPEWMVIDAVYASSCLPILFSPQYCSLDPLKSYIDGGLLMNYPLNHCLKDGHDPETIMGIYRKDPKPDQCTNLTPTHNLLEYMYNLMNKVIKKMEIPINPQSIAIQIQIPFLSLDINAIIQCIRSEEERSRNIQIGINCVLRFIEENISNPNKTAAKDSVQMQDQCEYYI